ncbi:MAG TPA: adenosylcobinamide-GDP ribazoletransferase [Methanoculleus sp.]|nr:adenosylcobinamide-GDP ribazoletransferase [Methanoculleus sp.]
MNAIIALLQFCTILPLGKPAEYDAFAYTSYLYPLAGWVIGAIAAIPALFIADGPIAASIALALALVLSGCNHLDGLLDFGDGLMAHGSREKRISALTDRQIGTGGVAAAIIVILIAFSGLLSVPEIAIAIIVAEVCAKAAMALLTVAGPPFREGLHSYLHARTRPWFPLATALLCLPLFLLPGTAAGTAAALATTLVVVAALRALAMRLFGGVNGDVVGASNEITRALSLVALALAW